MWPTPPQRNNSPGAQSQPSPTTRRPPASVPWRHKTQFLLTKDGRLKLDRGFFKLNDLNSAYFVSTRPDGTPCEFSAKPWQRVVPWRPPEFALGEVSSKMVPNGQD